MARFGPVVTAMITPMRDDGSVDYPEARRLASWLCERGSTGLVLAGTTGESPTLRDDEKVKLFREIVAEIGGRAKVIANTGGNDTHHSIELSKQAQACGVDALLVVGPYYNKPPQAGLIGHFSAIADAVEIPIVIYNIPGRTAVNILPETIATLSDHPRIAGVKESSGDLMQIGELITKVAKDFDVYSGDDHLTLPIMAIGGCGVVSVASHVAGDEIRAMCDAYADGDVLQAAQLHQAVLPLIKALFAVTSPIPVKAAMQRFGFATGACRPPLCALTPEQERALDRALAPWRDRVHSTV
ncbi:MAG TPA: 4-hydroxy-tetrahydrodipicolinate synthase [Candidatus Eremiobacteraceae bacterium]|nr:4-hydroxy-tetrahydrodipicolinate synthase [Candidatus Eremiobacteraceae bacterium]